MQPYPLTYLHPQLQAAADTVCAVLAAADPVHCLSGVLDLPTCHIICHAMVAALPNMPLVAVDGCYGLSYHSWLGLGHADPACTRGLVHPYQAILDLWPTTGTAPALHAVMISAMPDLVSTPDGIPHSPCRPIREYQRTLAEVFMPLDLLPPEGRRLAAVTHPYFAEDVARMTREFKRVALLCR